MSTASHNLTAPCPEQEFSRLSARYVTRLRFPHALEASFARVTAATRAQRRLHEAWPLTLGFLSFIACDCAVLPQHIALVILIRLAAVLPLAAIAPVVLSRNPNPRFTETAFTITGITVAASTFLLYRGASSTLLPVVEILTLATLCAANTMLRVSFTYGLTTTATIFAINTVCLATDKSLLPGSAFASSLAMLWASGLVLLANYSLERQRRLNFLVSMRSEQHAEALAAANSELTHRSAHDALTGLHNRASFDAQLQVLWRESMDSHHPLSAVIIDVDHFKVVNDTQGHLFGDEVLKRVASLVQQSLRGKRDFAARYGGEEFVLLLPETDLDAAYKVAERIRAIVQIAGSPAPMEGGNAPQGLYTTVSCGVSSIIPSSASTTRDLIHAADKALYAAKSAGRNRVHTALNTPADDLDLIATGWS